MTHRFTARRPRTLRGLIVIAAALLGAFVPIGGAPAASARTTPAAAIVQTVHNAALLTRAGDAQCVEAGVLAVEKRHLLKNADHFAGAVDAVLRNPAHHRCAALVDYLRQTSA